MKAASPFANPYRRLTGLALGALGMTAVAASSLSGCATSGPPKGDTEKPSDEDEAKIHAVGAKLKAKIVWSSSRIGNHDLFVSNGDGSEVKAITKGDAVDWFPRFSPDGERILFVRSKKGWVAERDANAEGKWDLFLIPSEGGKPEKLIDNASWGTWVDKDTILFVRGTKIYRKNLTEDKETVLVDSEKVADLDGALLQQPEMSSDRRYIAITLRGSKRETGIFDLKAKTWTRTGEGCQINWTPDGKSVYWVHPTGKGGSRVFMQEMAGNKPVKELDDDERTFIDLPGRRSHEYFPQLSADGKWLVWGATQRGHDHDVADYEIYVWQVGSPAEDAARLTFHSGNDRWPDIYIPGSKAAAQETGEAAGEAAAATKPEETEAPVTEKVAVAPAEPEEASLQPAATTSKAKKFTKKSKKRPRKASRRR